MDATLQAQFESAAQAATSLAKRPDNETMLRLSLIHI